MINKIKRKNLSFVPLSLISMASVVSCSNKVVFSNKQNENKEIDWNYEYLHAFREEEYNDSNLLHNVWIWNEKIYDNEKFKIYVEGEKDNSIYLDLFNKEVKNDI